MTLLRSYFLQVHAKRINTGNTKKNRALPRDAILHTTHLATLFAFQPPLERIGELFIILGNRLICFIIPVRMTGKPQFELANSVSR